MVASLPSAFDLTGRVALVTGAYRGLGFAIARGMADAGATVVLNGRKRDELAKAAQSLTGADTCVFDVTKRDAVAKGVAEVRPGARLLCPEAAIL